MTYHDQVRPATHPDRTVHAQATNGDELVRYDRAGKWFLEWSGGRRRVLFAEAVALASRPGMQVHLGKPGGAAFDRYVSAVLLRRIEAA